MITFRVTGGSLSLCLLRRGEVILSPWGQTTRRCRQERHESAGGDHVDISAETSPLPLPGEPAPLIKPFNTCHLHQQHIKLVWSSGMTFASHLLRFSTNIGGQRWNATGPRFDPWYEHIFASSSPPPGGRGGCGCLL